MGLVVCTVLYCTRDACVCTRDACCVCSILVVLLATNRQTPLFVCFCLWATNQFLFCFCEQNKQFLFCFCEHQTGFVCLLSRQTQFVLFWPNETCVGWVVLLATKHIFLFFCFFFGDIHVVFVVGVAKTYFWFSIVSNKTSMLCFFVCERRSTFLYVFCFMSNKYDLCSCVHNKK